MAENAVTAVQWLSEAGFRTFEITLTTPDAIKIIARLISKTDALIGAGTVTSVKQAKKCIAAGAQYIVSHCVVHDLPAMCHKYDIPWRSSQYEKFRDYIKSKTRPVFEDIGSTVIIPTSVIISIKKITLC